MQKRKLGLYIVIEGIVGVGKSTYSKLLVEYLRQKYPNRKVILTHEPGGDEIADAIRQLVQGEYFSTFSEEMQPVCETYLYAASRAQTLRTIVQPVLKQDGIVVSDRSFLSSAAYQGTGRESQGIETVLEINKVAVSGILPDLVIYLSLDLSSALTRTSDTKGDKFEKEDTEFFRRVAEGYRTVSRMEPFRDRWINIPVKGLIEEVFVKILDELEPFLP